MCTPSPTHAPLTLPQASHSWKLTESVDDPDVYEGGPVGIQIVGRKFEEEKVWAIAKIVHATLQRGSTVSTS